MKSKTPARGAAAGPTASAATKSAPVRKPRTRKIASVDAATAVANDTIAAVLSAERIAQRAYALFLAQGGEHGRDVEHWLAAELELTHGDG